MILLIADVFIAASVMLKIELALCSCIIRVNIFIEFARDHQGGHLDLMLATCSLWEHFHLHRRHRAFLNKFTNQIRGALHGDRAAREIRTRVSDGGRARSCLTSALLIITDNNHGAPEQYNRDLYCLISRTATSPETFEFQACGRQRYGRRSCSQQCR